MLGAQLIGFTATLNAIDTFSKKTLGLAEKKMWEAVLMLERDSKVWCTQMGAVDTGRLRSSIKGLVYKIPNGYLGEVSASVEYAIFVHEGTMRMLPRPFLETALVEDKKKIDRLMSQGFKEASTKFVR